MFQSIYFGKTLSDHNPLEMCIAWGRVSSGIPTWRLQSVWIEDGACKGILDEAITQYLQDNKDTSFNTVIMGVCICTTIDAHKTLTDELTQTDPP